MTTTELTKKDYAVLLETVENRIEANLGNQEAINKYKPLYDKLWKIVNK